MTQFRQYYLNRFVVDLVDLAYRHVYRPLHIAFLLNNSFNFLDFDDWLCVFGPGMHDEILLIGTFL